MEFTNRMVLEEMLSAVARLSRMLARCCRSVAKAPASSSRIRNTGVILMSTGTSPVMVTLSTLEDGSNVFMPDEAPEQQPSAATTCMSSTSNFAHSL